MTSLSELSSIKYRFIHTRQLEKVSSSFHGFQFFMLTVHLIKKKTCVKFVDVVLSHHHKKYRLFSCNDSASSHDEV
jgi:hypothetical protein